MTEIMIPSVKTTLPGQIDKAVANYRAMLEKHANQFSAEAVQIVLGQSGLAGEQFSVFRRRVEVLSDIIIRRVTVNRNRTSQEALSATCRTQCVANEVVAAMPRGGGDEVEVVFFKPKSWEYTKPDWMSNDDLEKAFDRRGLKAADPISVAAVNEEDPTFADQHPNYTHWKDSKGRWCLAAFFIWHGDRRTEVVRRGFDWPVDWRFAGLRK